MNFVCEKLFIVNRVTLVISVWAERNSFRSGQTEMMRGPPEISQHSKLFCSFLKLAAGLMLGGFHHIDSGDIFLIFALNSLVSIFKSDLKKR